MAGPIRMMIHPIDSSRKAFAPHRDQFVRRTCGALFWLCATGMIAGGAMAVKHARDPDSTTFNWSLVAIGLGGMGTGAAGLRSLQHRY